MTNAYQLPQTAEEIAAYLERFDRLAALDAVPMPLYSDDSDD